MKQEEKDLLLKDLYARLPYNIAIDCRDEDSRFTCYLTTDILREIQNNTCYWECKPYLFPLSSMTEEQWINAPRADITNFTFESFKCGCFTIASYTCDNNLYDLVEFLNWLIENHFDINGLIEKGLAIDATELNIY